jgi:TetR/AcrR family transcriptional repressor of nem operon
VSTTISRPRREWPLRSRADTGIASSNGVLGAEAGGLPPEVVAEIAMFFRRCIDDLSSRIGGADAVARAFHVMAALEGGLILARAYGDISAFDQATVGLTGPRFAVA